MPTATAPPPTTPLDGRTAAEGKVIENAFRQKAFVDGSADSLAVRLRKIGGEPLNYQETQYYVSKGGRYSPQDPGGQGAAPTSPTDSSPAVSSPSLVRLPAEGQPARQDSIGAAPPGATFGNDYSLPRGPATSLMEALKRGINSPRDAMQALQSMAPRNAGEDIAGALKAAGSLLSEGPLSPPYEAAAKGVAGIPARMAQKYVAPGPEQGALNAISDPLGTLADVDIAGGLAERGFGALRSAMGSGAEEAAGEAGAVAPRAEAAPEAAAAPVAGSVAHSGEVTREQAHAWIDQQPGPDALKQRLHAMVDSDPGSTIHLQGEGPVDLGAATLPSAPEHPTQGAELPTQGGGTPHVSGGTPHAEGAAPFPPEVPQIPGVALADPREAANLPPGVHPAKDVYDVDTDLIQKDPERFQFKTIGIGKGGVSNILEGLKGWDRSRAGVVSLWRDPEDGQIYVVNGHHRLTYAQGLNAAANAAGGERPVKTMLSQFIDAPTAEEARMQGALQNISEGRGEPLDAAKLFRDGGMTREDLIRKDVPINDRLAREGIALAQLPDDLWRQVWTGELPEKIAVGIGRSGLDDEGQRALMAEVSKQVAKNRPVTDEWLRQMTLAAKAAPTQNVDQLNLFGKTEVSQNLLGEKASLVEYLQKRLGVDKNLFGYVSKEGRAADLARGGNVIDAETSGEISKEATLAGLALDQVAHVMGSPVSDVLNVAAGRVAAGEKVAAVGKSIYGSVKDQLSDFVSRGGFTSESAGGAAERSGVVDTADAGRQGPLPGGAQPAPADSGALRVAPGAEAATGASATAEPGVAGPSLFGAETPTAERVAAASELIQRANAGESVPFTFRTQTGDVKEGVLGPYKNAAGQSGYRFTLDGADHFLPRSTAEESLDGLGTLHPTTEAPAAEPTAPGAASGNLFGDESGRANVGALTGGIGQDVVQARSLIGRAWQGARDAWLRVYNPRMMGPEANTTGLALRANLADMDRDVAAAKHVMEQSRATFDALVKAGDHQTILDVVNRIETGQGQVAPEFQQFADDTRATLDGLRNEITQKTGRLAEFDENYMPRYWQEKDPTLAGLQAQTAGRRPMAGSKAFLKQRTFQTLEEGMAAGFTPISMNPVDWVELKAQEMRRFLFASDMKNELAANGHLRFVKVGGDVPEGWKPINDNFFKAFSPGRMQVPITPEDLQGHVPDDALDQVQQFSKEWNAGGVVQHGQWYAPDGAAQVLNNYLSPTLRGNDAYSLALDAKHKLVQAALSASGYHYITTGLNIAGTEFATALKDATAGDAGSAIRNALDAVIPGKSTVDYWKLGQRMANAYVSPGSEGPEIERLVNAYVQGGGQATADPFYRPQMGQNASEWGTIGKTLGAAGTLADKVSGPLFEKLVPYAKNAAFANQWGQKVDELVGRYGSIDAIPQDVLRSESAKLVDNVNNLFGQYRTQNALMDNRVRDILHLVVANPGWMKGSLDLFGGAARDTGQFLKDAVTLHKPTLTHQMALGFGLTVAAAELGSVIHTALTGHPPQSLNDVFHPQTGKLDENGAPERLNLPGYVPGQWEAWRSFSQAQRSFYGKLNPNLRIGLDLVHNRDYRGAQIYDPELPETIPRDLTNYGINQVAPIAVRGAESELSRGDGPKGLGLSMIGFNPASRVVDMTPAESTAQQLLGAQAPQGSKSMAQQAILDLRSQLRRAQKTGDTSGVGDTLGKMEASGLISPGSANAILKSGTLAPVSAMFNSLKDPIDRFKVLEQANPKELADLHPSLVKTFASVESDGTVKPTETLSKLFQLLPAADRQTLFDVIKRQPTPQNAADLQRSYGKLWRDAHNAQRQKALSIARSSALSGAR